MKVLREVTDWAVPNHTYFVNDSKDKLFAYIKSSSVLVEEFKKPITFSTSHRKFQEIENTFGYELAEEPVLALGKEYRVAGSGKNIYTVREHLGEWTCTCPASRWQKGPCKHILSLAK
jgi:hypothetical protein